MAGVTGTDVDKSITDSSCPDLEDGNSCPEENGSLNEQVVDIYQKIKRLLTGDDYGECLRNELEKSNPEYLKDLEKRLKDLEKCDHGIVIAGETSAGKSTLINKILEKRILTAGIRETTSAICKIRNSKRVRIITELSTGEQAAKDYDINIETPEGVDGLCNKIKDVATFEACEGKMYRSVDIGFPIPMLKGNTILVDTPGIGANEELNQRLKEYLPNAVSFIFVINVAHAGGMQTDRLPEILNAICRNMVEEMPCFDPEDAIFITNKWDTIRTDDDNIDLNVEKAKLWKFLKASIKERWSSVKEENIFQLNLHEVSPAKANTSNEQFKDFKKKLVVNIEKADNIRVIRHICFLQQLLRNVHSGLIARLNLKLIEEGAQIALAVLHAERRSNLTQKNQKVKETLRKRITATIEDIVKKCYAYMSSEEGKEHILNPEGMIPIIKDSWNPTNFEEKVGKRVSLYVRNFLRSKDVLQMFLDIRNELISFTQKACSELSKLEIGWLHERNDELNIMFADFDFSMELRLLKLYQDLRSIPILPLGIYFNIGCVMTSFALLPISLPVILYLDRDSRKQKIIDEAYSKIMSSVCDDIRSHLDSTSGHVLRQMVYKVTGEFLPRRIEHMRTIEQQLLNFRTEILRNRNLYMRLYEEVKSMEESAINLQKDLARNRH